MKIKLVLSYDGSAYSGWQMQDNALTIQQVLEEALKRLTSEKIKTTASGRTDAGVHAIGQVVSFSYAGKIPADKFYLALNPLLPSDIKATSSEEVNEDFCACRSAKRKTYVYSTYVSEVDLPLLDKYSTRINRLGNFSLMKRLAKKFIGEHDFKCFCASGSSAKTTVRRIYSLKIKRRGNKVKFIVTGNGFLYNMVRTLVGTLLKIAKGDCSKTDVEKMLTTGDRMLVGETMPAKALTLLSVEY